MSATPAVYNRNNPFAARIKENRLLNKAGSEKDTRHIVVDVSGQVPYHAGDSLGVFPRNVPQVVSDLMSKLKLDPETPVPAANNTTVALKEALSSQYILNRASKKFVKGIVEKVSAGSKKDALTTLIANETALDEYVFSRDYVDVINEYPEVSLNATELLGLINKVAPRLYSIASSSLVYPNEVHLTVAVVKYNSHGRDKMGIASGYLGYHSDQTPTPVYTQPTRHFHLPPVDKNIIMVGPGTGIAPFRAFLQERKATGATGKNWLFFGDQRRATDYLYEEEFEAALKEGSLHQLDLAFSRDQAEKIYVQTRMMEKSKEMWKWLQEGAYFYVCGDAKRMARDVHQALIDIAKKEGGLSQEAAEAYINTTFAKDEKRYLKDVY